MVTITRSQEHLPAEPPARTFWPARPPRRISLALDAVIAELDAPDLPPARRAALRARKALLEAAGGLPFGGVRP